MEEITVSAKTLDDAITEALVQLGVTSDQLDYDVIEKGSTGFLGFGMKQAVIKARRKNVKNEIEEPVIDFSDAVKGVKESSFENTQREARENRQSKESYGSRENRESRENKKRKDKKNRDRSRSKQMKREEKPEMKLDVKQDVGETPVKSESFEKPEKAISEKKEVELAKVEDATIKACEEFLHNVLAAMGMEVTIKSHIDEEGALSIEMSGENMGILIGKRGQTLDSLQYLTNRVANKMQSGYVRVKLDTEDYRRRRI